MKNIKDFSLSSIKLAIRRIDSLIDSFYSKTVSSFSHLISSTFLFKKFSPQEV